MDNKHIHKVERRNKYRLDNAEYWVFEKGRFVEMWDEWYRGKIDPRKVNDVDEYRIRGRQYLLTPGDAVLWIIGTLMVGMLLGVTLGMGLVW